VPDSNARLCLRDLFIDLSETASLFLCQSHNISFVAHTEALQLNRELISDFALLARLSLESRQEHDQSTARHKCGTDQDRRPSKQTPFG
jgi:hypothetical protein